MTLTCNQPQHFIRRIERCFAARPIMYDSSTKKRGNGQFSSSCAACFTFASSAVVKPCGSRAAELGTWLGGTDGRSAQIGLVLPSCYMSRTAGSGYSVVCGMLYYTPRMSKSCQSIITLGTIRNVITHLFPGLRHKAANHDAGISTGDAEEHDKRNNR